MNICVFCGSGAGTNPVYAQTAHETGKLLAANQHTLIFGGGNIGLMGIIADACLEYGGKVIGVIPDFLIQREVGHNGLTELLIVQSMHERKRRMADLADAFIALPGGWGTLDETAEILTWKQLGLIHQPVGVLNTNHFFDQLIGQMQHMVNEGFLQKHHLDQLIVADTPEKLLTSIFP